MTMQQGFYPKDTFDVDEMASFMRRPDIYMPSSDVLAPPAEVMGFEAHLLNPHTWTVGCFYGPHIIGFVQFIQKTSIGGEIHCGFHPQARGRIAKAFGQYAIDMAFAEKGFLKLWGIIPSDNKQMLWLARHMGFTEEGRIHAAIARGESSYNVNKPGYRFYPAGLRDLVIMGLKKPQMRDS